MFVHLKRCKLGIYTSRLKENSVITTSLSACCQIAGTITKSPGQNCGTGIIFYSICIGAFTKDKAFLSKRLAILAILQRLKIQPSVEYTGDGLVFAQPDGQPLLPDSVTQAWRNLTKRAGLKGIRLHDARHTHASLKLKQGIHPKIVQERLGHASIQLTLDTYSHVTPGLQEAAAIGFDRIVNFGIEKELIESNYQQIISKTEKAPKFIIA